MPPLSKDSQVSGGTEGFLRALFGPFRAGLLMGKDPKPTGASEFPGTAWGNAGSQAPRLEIPKQEGWHFSKPLARVS